MLTLLQPYSLSTGVPEVLVHEKLQSRIPVDVCECSKVSSVSTVSTVSTVNRAEE